VRSGAPPFNDGDAPPERRWADRRGLNAQSLRHPPGGEGPRRGQPVRRAEPHTGESLCDATCKYCVDGRGPSPIPADVLKFDVYPRMRTCFAGCARTHLGVCAASRRNLDLSDDIAIRCTTSKNTIVSNTSMWPRCRIEAAYDAGSARAAMGRYDFWGKGSLSLKPADVADPSDRSRRDLAGLKNLHQRPDRPLRARCHRRDAYGTYQRPGARPVQRVVVPRVSESGIAVLKSIKGRAS